MRDEEIGQMGKERTRVLSDLGDIGKVSDMDTYN